MTEDLLEGLNFTIASKSGSELSYLSIVMLSVVFGVFISFGIDIPGLGSDVSSTSIFVVSGSL